MRILKLSRLEEIKSIEKEWKELLERSSNQSVFMTWEWLVTWWEIFGGNHDLWWLLVRDSDGELLGGAPLYLRKHQDGLLLPHREMRFVGTGASVSPEHLDILTDPKHSEEVLGLIGKYLAAHFSQWDVLLLTDTSRSASAVNGLRNELKFRGAYASMECQTPSAPYIPLPSDWEVYFKSLGKWLRRTITRQRNKLTRECAMTFDVWTGEKQDLKSAFDAFEKLYAARKKSVGVGNKFEGAFGYRAFHHRLAERFSKQGWLHLAFLKINGNDAAAEYTFQYQNTLYSYQCGFDPVYAKNNVFKVLRSYVIEHAVKRGLTEFDLLRGEESYKYDWNALTRKKQMLRSFSPTFYGRTLQSVFGLRRMGGRMARNLAGARSHSVAGVGEQLP